MFPIDDSNLVFKLATELVNFSSLNIFLTGKAGTGKTTFLKFIQETCAKQTVVVAPTGVAAINAGGSTIHSFFQLPLSPFVPAPVQDAWDDNVDISNKHTLIGRMRVTIEKIKILQQLDLLIIDEISMVRCDIMDAIDTILRHFRNRHDEPFGGVQVLMIGDLYQLPPVIPQEEWEILSKFYASPYFFSSYVLQHHTPLCVEFEKIYRQTDENFISLLNLVRNNKMDHENMKLLHNRYQPEFNPEREEEYIILTTHNYKADFINKEKLNKLPGELFTFKAKVEGEFTGKSYPADEVLQLKKGSQVMFLKNDSERIRRYFNGKIGFVTKIEDEKIFVQCKNEHKEIEVTKEHWENNKYSFDKYTQQLKQEQIGSFVQFPLRLAWAITIHKSQGLTFEKAIIDAGAAFAPGQVYVALSRCTSLEGLVLKSRIFSPSLLTDERIVIFSMNNSNTDELQEKLSEGKLNYQKSLLFSLFDFSLILSKSRQLAKFVQEHKSTFSETALAWLNEMESKIRKVQDVSDKFNPQLSRLLLKEELSGMNTILQQRLISAAKYFKEEFQKITQFLAEPDVITDSRPYASEFNEILFDIYFLTSEKKFLFQNCCSGFDAESWHTKKKCFKLPLLNVNVYAAASSAKPIESPHPILYQQLRKHRDYICLKNGIPIYLVASSRTLDEMARYLPQTVDDLQKISGFGKSKCKTYGKEFVEIIQKYCEEQQLESLIYEKSPKRERKIKIASTPDTKFDTFNLYKQGITIEEIAKQRNLSKQTIEGHLAYYVEKGDIKIEDLLKAEIIKKIEPVLKNFAGVNLSIIKQRLGKDIGFGEIRLVLADLEYQKNSRNNTI